AGADGVLDAHRVKPVLHRQPAVGAVLAVRDDHLDPAVAEVERMGVALRAEAQHGDRLPLQRVERGVLLVDHLQRLWHGIFLWIPPTTAGATARWRNLSEGVGRVKTAGALAGDGLPQRLGEVLV